MSESGADAAALVRMLEYLVAESAELDPPSKALENALNEALAEGVCYQSLLRGAARPSRKAAH